MEPLNPLTRWLQKAVSPSAAPVAPSTPDAAPQGGASEGRHARPARSAPPPPRRDGPVPARGSAPQRGPAPMRNDGPRMVLQVNGKHHTALDAGDSVVRAVNLSGLEQVGRNMSAYFYKNDIITIDCGLEFADATMPGVDYAIPDVTILEERKQRIRGMLITHAHLDHIGALQHVLPRLDFPTVYATRLTAGLIRERLAEHGMDKKTKIIEVNPDEDRVFKLGAFEVEFFRVNHSIPDSTGIAIHTPNGTLVHTGDFKFDLSPSDGQKADFAKIARLGKEGVMLAFSDSTNSEKPGATMSESVIGGNLEDAILKAEGRMIIATFASLIGRMQYVLNAAMKSGRTVFVSGRSMTKNIEISEKLGYLKIPRGLVKPLKEGILAGVPPDRTLILCTGSQGEDMSALTRIANGEHSTVKIQQGDTVLFSSSPIPGNEGAVVAVVDSLMRLGAKVITNKNLNVHVSGHGNQEDLKLMLTLLQPNFFCPVHGLLYMRSMHKELAVKSGVRPENIFLVDNGVILECLPSGQVKLAKQDVPLKNIVVDGLGVNEQGSGTLHERILMRENGVVFVVFKADKEFRLLGEPSVVSRGFVYLKESEAMGRDITEAAKKAFNDAIGRGARDLKAIRQEVSRNLEYIIAKKLGREPLVLAFTVVV